MSPKSVASPVDAIVTNSMTFVLLGFDPPPNTPRIITLMFHLVLDNRNSQITKILAFPVVARVINSIVFEPLTSRI